jgi:single-strand DNA-binding protein
MNIVFLFGRLGHDPSLRYTPNGTAVVSFSLATNERWINDAGERQERTTWHHCVAYGKLGETIAEHFSKGDQMLLQGRISVRQYEKDGQKRTLTEIVVTTFDFAGTKKKATANETKATNNNEAEGAANEDDMPF